MLLQQKVDEDENLVDLIEFLVEFEEMSDADINHDSMSDNNDGRVNF